MKHTSAVLVVAFVLVLAPPAISEVESRGSHVCDDLDTWLAAPLPPNLIGVLCTIADESNPVGLELNEDVPTEQESESESDAPIEENDVPEETKQQALLVLLVWSQT